MITNSSNALNSQRVMPQMQGLKEGRGHDHKEHGQVKAVDGMRTESGVVKVSDGFRTEAQVSPQKVIEQNLVGSLEKTLNTTGLSLQGIDEGDFTPKKVAGRLLSFAETVLQNHPEAKDDIKKGFERGFHDAREMLQGMGFLKGDVKKDIEHTQQLVEKGLNKMGNHDTPPVAVSKMQFQAVSTFSSQSTEIEIETQEGDKVTISFNHTFSSSQSAFEVQSEQGSLSAFSQSSSMNSELNVSVNGDLNDDEFQAISDLMQQVNEISNSFYNGNLNAAFEQAQNVGFNMDQLSGFSLDLNLQQRVEAVAIYQEVSYLAEDDDDVVEDGSEAGVESLIPQAINFLDQAKATLAESTELLNSFADPKTVLVDMFTGIGQSLLSDIPEVEAPVIDLPSNDGLMAELVDHLADSVVDEETVV